MVLRNTINAQKFSAIAFLVCFIQSCTWGTWDTWAGMTRLDHSIVITKPLKSTQKSTDFLYPAKTAYKEGYLKVSNLHSLWYAEYGNPQGVPIVFVHGGPGAGCGSSSSRFFDSKHYRIILFEQRGA